MTGNLMQASNTELILLNGALAETIFRQVAGHVVVSTGAKMRGILLLVKTDVLFEADSSLDWPAINCR
jgi:hypothetical protein